MAFYCIVNLMVWKYFTAGKKGGTQARQTDKQAHTQAHTDLPTQREKEKHSQTFLHINKANTELSPVLTKAVRRCSIAM